MSVRSDKNLENKKNVQMKWKIQKKCNYIALSYAKIQFYLMHFFLYGTQCFGISFSFGLRHRPKHKSVPNSDWRVSAVNVNLI